MKRQAPLANKDSYIIAFNTVVDHGGKMPYAAVQSVVHATEFPELLSVNTDVSLRHYTLDVLAKSISADCALEDCLL